jgi:hypothetical protein
MARGPFGARAAPSIHFQEASADVQEWITGNIQEFGGLLPECPKRVSNRRGMSDLCWLPTLEF